MIITIMGDIIIKKYIYSLHVRTCIVVYYYTVYIIIIFHAVVSCNMINIISLNAVEFDLLIMIGIIFVNFAMLQM